MKARFSVVGFCLIIAISMPCKGEIASDAKMASEALLPYVGSRDIVAVTSRVLNEKQKALKSITSDPVKTVSGTVIFSTGITLSQLRAMAEEAELTVFQVELKAPLGNDGSVNSVSIGAEDLTRVRGDLEERLRNAVAVARGVMLEMAQALDGEEAANYRAMAVGQLRIYSVRLFGEARRLQPIMERRDVSFLRIDTTDDFIRGYHQLKEQNAKIPVKWRLGRPPEH